MQSTNEFAMASAIELQARGGGFDSDVDWVHTLSAGAIAVAFAMITGVLIWLLRSRVNAPLRTKSLVVGATISCSGALVAIGLCGAQSSGFLGIGIIQAAFLLVAAMAGAGAYRRAPFLVKAPGAADDESGGPTIRSEERGSAFEESIKELRSEIAERDRSTAAGRALSLRLGDRVEEMETLIKVLPVGVAIAEDPGCAKVRGNPQMNHLLRLDADRNMSLSSPAGDAPSNFQVWRHGRRLLPEELPMQTAGRENREVHNFEETIVHADGTRHEIICDVVPLRRQDGTVRGVVGVFRDVTELKRAAEEHLLFERKMLETHKLQSIGHLAAGVAHDFNNLLAVIKGAAELARSESGVPEPAIQRLRTVDIAVRRASDLCQQMLSYAGQGQMSLQKVDVNESVQHAVGLVRSSFPRGRDVELRLDSTLGTIESDPSQMVQVVVNLFTNALEASERTVAPVRISTSIVEIEQKDLQSIQPVDSLVPGRCIALCVQDEGVNMDAVALSQLFTPFFSTKFRGRGLGLAAVLGVARSHRGGVRVWSQPSRGTRVEVFFPVTQTHDMFRPATSTRMTSGAKRPRRVLVVDDEAMFRRVIASLLLSQRFEAETAGGGREALEMLQTGDYGLVMLDATMPGMDGLETMRRLKHVKPDIPVVVISGSSREEVTARFRPLNPEAILHKPFELLELQRVLDQIFGSGE